MCIFASLREFERVCARSLPVYGIHIQTENDGKLLSTFMYTIKIDLIRYHSIYSVVVKNINLITKMQRIF